MSLPAARGARLGRVWRAVVIYAIAAWVIIQVANNVFPPLGLSPWTVTLVVVAAIVGFPCAVVLAWFDLSPERWLPQSRGVAAVGAPEAPQESPLERSRVAVLPFANISPDPVDAYFADGMTEEMISSLSHIEGIRVIARTSIMQYKGVARSIAEIARELRVGSIVEGSVRKAGGSLRITVNLVDTQTQEQLWTKEYDRQLSDLFAIQSEVALHVASALRLQLVGGQRTRIERRGPADMATYSLYLLGKQAFTRRTEAGLQTSIDYFEQAIARESGFALARAGLADALCILGDYGFAPPREAFPRAKAAAARAITLDGSLAEAHTAMAYVLWAYDWEWSGAERAFQRAVERNPSYANGHQWYGEFLTSMGRHEEALARIRHALELDPLSLITNAVVGWALYFARHFDEAAEAVRRTLAMDPGFARAHVYLGRIYKAQGRLEDAIAEFKEGLRVSGDNPQYLAELGHTFGIAGYPEEALKTLAQLEAQASQHHVSPYDRAMINLGLGDHAKASGELEQACQDRRFYLVFLNVDPIFDVVRGTPRFEDLVKRVGLPPIPRTS